MKRVLSIQDLSCVGRCSLTVALPVLSAMGVECSVLPTAVLSTHTGFPQPKILPLTGQLEPFAEHWRKIGASFDAVSIGYLADPAQTQAVLAVLERFGQFVILDPVMGDHGQLYSGITDAHILAMRQLCQKADVLLPNMTEAARLTGLPYRQTPDTAYLSELAAGLLEFGAKAVLITGIRWETGGIGFYGAHWKDGPFVYDGEYIPKRLHGTGDLFSAAFTGFLMAGVSVQEAGSLSAGFVRQAVAATNAVTPYGVEFEKVLPWLWQQLKDLPHS